MTQQKIRTCQQCKKEFTIAPEDFAFYEKIQVPAPTWCPQCRMIRRMTFRNVRTIYKRKVVGTDKEVLSSFSASSPLKIYEQPYWMSDEWDAMRYGREYDFSRPFFQQLKELMLDVPWAHGYNSHSINSDYCNNCDSLKNSYLLFNSGFSEECFYGSEVLNSSKCIDNTNIFQCEFCYECIDCQKCFNCFYDQDCVNCIEVFFSSNLADCHDCVGCVNLKHKSFCIFNVQYTEEEYKQRIANMHLNSYAAVQELIRHVREFQLTFPHKFMHGQANEEVSGDYLNHCKNTRASFLSKDLEDCAYSQLILFLLSKDSYDITVAGGELCYELEEGGGYNVRFAWLAIPKNLGTGQVDLTDIEYVMNCYGVSNIFGCVGLKKKQYCILNKQYTKDEYERLRKRIIQHMSEMPYIDSQGRAYRYGEFFPTELSPFAYNETLAQEFFPLTKEEALQQGYVWRDSEERIIAPTLFSHTLPDTIEQIDTNIATKLIECQHTGTCTHQCTKVFKIIVQELEFYKKFNLPLPRLCHNCRHYERIQKRNPLVLHQRACQCAGHATENAVYTNNTAHNHGTEHCSNTFTTTFSPDRKEIVYCEECYQKEVV
ncbi:MAG: hypothetical protein A2233_03115 [Candidatus Kerfeldbacteria bacterium RIFOXYA2_FULL_38_24]|uniref:Uncharacterized protein n=1 Tax=Candidatus Kerfeldbacteria bacterium RIFOXYB2_FULL_38_14 TaxID=1798547 RepID=A0A1G2BBV1_9BACT|nr:MAG: hypothetical protein A2233_03115 [Candidatus Kerfeldbacteria bacterium RIFOXYA2_FULL_38_24]OGY86186.1 MAG: hypothetical protein A2319_03315 [Candidatus Kerfeldbacteria bacterium RIFOXYB2_FULL_38_14]